LKCNVDGAAGCYGNRNGSTATAHPIAKLLAAPKRQFTYDITVEELPDVLWAPSVITHLIVRILWEGPARDGLRLGGHVVAKHFSEKSLFTAACQ
jgi:hypothetical protein